jgi:hypothetical protein
MNKTKLLLFGVVMMLLGNVCFAQDISYPDVWWREIPSHLKAKGFGVIFLGVEKSYEANPSDSPEIYMVMEKRNPLRQLKNAERVFAIQEFFSGKQWRVKQVVFGDKKLPEKFRLSDGVLLELIPTAATPQPESEFEDMDNEEGQKTAPPARFGVQVVSAFTGLTSEVEANPFLKWVRPSVRRYTDLNAGILSCDPFYWGLQAFDKEGKRLWQHVIAAYGKPVLKSLGKSGKSGADPYIDGCWSPGQYEVDTSNTIGPTLRDDTLLLYVGDYLLRIRFKDGFPDRIPSNVSIVQYANVMRLKEALSDGAIDFFVNKAIGVWRYRREIAPNIDRNNYLALQGFFFPQLTARRLPSTANKVQPATN